MTWRTPRATTPVGVRWTDLKTPGFHWSGPAAGSVFPEAAIALPPELKSWSPPRLVRVEAPAGRTRVAARPLLFVLLDTVDDGRRDYDTLAALADARAGVLHSRTPVLGSGPMQANDRFHPSARGYELWGAHLAREIIEEGTVLRPARDLV